MKIYWSVIHSLLLATLVSCGGEQFGTTPQSTSNSVQAPTGYKQYSCSSHTLIKPKVDVLYVVDNSGSIFDIQDAVKAAIKNTANTISQNFDYRLISTKLIQPQTDSTPYDDYLVLTNSTDALPDTSKKVSVASELFNFVYDGKAMERGLGRTYEFMNHHKNSLLRNGAYQIVVLVSNGRDDQVAGDSALFASTLTNYQTLKGALQAPQLRFLSVTAKGSCGKSAADTYVKMSTSLNSSSDSFDICSSSLSNLFSVVNSTIQQVIIPHHYRYWPMTFAKVGDTENSFGEIKVYKVSGNSAPVLVPASEWTYHESTQGWENTRELPTVGERADYKHFVRFNNLVTYPDCIQIEAKSRTEYFGYIILPRAPQLAGIYVTINGNSIPQSSTNGWTYIGNVTVPKNIKMPYPNAGDDLPKVEKMGFMIQLNGSSNYYKSGDNVQVNFIPAAI